MYLCHQGVTDNLYILYLLSNPYNALTINSFDIKTQWMDVRNLLLNPTFQVLFLTSYDPLHFYTDNQPLVNNILLFMKKIKPRKCKNIQL